MEDEVAATQAALEAVENDSLLSPAFSSRCILDSVTISQFFFLISDLTNTIDNEVLL